MVMLCEQLAPLIGLHCTPMSEDGTLALIETPFRFPDGDALEIYAEQICDKVRFFDDCATLWHLSGRGLDCADDRRLRPLAGIVEEHGLHLSDRGEIEVVAGHAGAADAFAQMLRALLAVARWEADSQDTDLDASDFVEDVAQTLLQAHPLLQRGTTIRGVTGRIVNVDLATERDLIFACRPRAQSVSAVLHKLIDINNATASSGMNTWVILDDRVAPDDARREGLLLAAVADVMPFTTLQRQGLVTPHRTAH